MCTVIKNCYRSALLFVSALGFVPSAFAFWGQPHVGADLYFLRLNSSVDDELNKNGWATHFKLGTIYDFSPMEYQVDLGLRYSSITGSQLDVSRRLRHLSAALEMAARYQITSQWSLGPEVDIYYGTDMTHTEQDADSASLLFMLGMNSRYRLDGTPLSLMLRASTDVNLSDQGLWAFGIGVLYHFGSPSSSAAPAQTYVEPESSFTDFSYIEAPRAEVSYEAEEKLIFMRLPEDVLLFETNMSHLEAPQRSYVRQIGLSLVEYQDYWDTLLVIGHTDQRGSDRINDELSEARARTVYNILVDSGVDPMRVESEGRGRRQLLELGYDDYSLSRNRRVEIQIDGVVEGSNLTEILRNLDPQANSEELSY